MRLSTETRGQPQMHFKEAHHFLLETPLPPQLRGSPVSTPPQQQTCLCKHTDTHTHTPTHTHTHTHTHTTATTLSFLIGSRISMYTYTFRASFKVMFVLRQRNI